MNKKKRRAGRILLWGTVVAVICAATIFGIQTINSMLRDETVGYLEEIASQEAKIVSERVRGDVNMLQGLAALLGQRSEEINDPSNLTVLRRQKNVSAFEEIGVILRDGSSVNCVGKQSTTIPQESIDRIFKGGDVITELRSENKEMKSVIIATPIYRQGLISGGVWAVYPADSLDKLLSVGSFGGNGYSYIAKRSGEVIAMTSNEAADPNFKNIYIDFSSAQFDTATSYNKFKQDVSQGESGTVAYFWNGSRRHMSYRPMEINDWYLLAVVPDQVIARKSRDFMNIVLWICGIIAGILLLSLGGTVGIRQKSRNALERAHFELKALSENIPGGVVRCSVGDGWKVFYASEGFLKMAGYTMAEFNKECGGRLCRLIHPEDYQRVKAMVEFNHEHLQVSQEEYRIICRDGSIRWIVSQSQRIQEEERGKSIYGVLLDVSNSKKIEEELRYNQERYSIILNQTKDIVFEWNLKTGKMDHSKFFQEKFGFDPASSDFFQDAAETGQIYTGDLDVFHKTYQSISAGAGYAEGEFRIRNREDRFIWCKVCITTAVCDDEGRPVRAVGIITDIDRQKRETEKYEEISKRDPMTGLYNRGAVEHLTTDYFSEGGVKSAALLIIDLDDFKSINDTLGHICGDKALIETARRLAQQFRKSDVVGRLGGDEFVVFLKEISEEYPLEEKAVELVNALSRPMEKDGVSFEISVSIGVARCPRDGVCYQELYDKADKALYCVKRHGKNSYSVYAEGA